MTDKHTPTDAAEQLEKGKILPLVFKLTVPAVIAQLITFVYNVVDRMFVARIDGSGMDALAALGVSFDKLLIDVRAHIVMPYHKELDELAEKAKGADAIGARNL